MKPIKAIRVFEVHDGFDPETGDLVRIERTPCRQEFLQRIEGVNARITQWTLREKPPVAHHATRSRTRTNTFYGGTVLKHKEVLEALAKDFFGTANIRLIIAGCHMWLQDGNKLGGRTLAMIVRQVQEYEDNEILPNVVFEVYLQVFRGV